MSQQNLFLKNKKSSDEWYTLYHDIEQIMLFYRNELEGKTIYCNCDHHIHSNFYKFFHFNFRNLKLRKLIATAYSRSGKGHFAEFDGTHEITGRLKYNGDFRSPETWNYIDECDIICSNPPFSIFADLIRITNDWEKDFILVGCLPAMNTIPFRQRIRDREVFVHHKSKAMDFMTPNGMKTLGSACWVSSFDDHKPFLELTEKYDPEINVKYDNYDAVEVPGYGQIPCDYFKPMGVPPSIFPHWNYDQFEYIRVLEAPYINGVAKFARIIIKRKSDNLVNSLDNQESPNTVGHNSNKKGK